MTIDPGFLAFLAVVLITGYFHFKYLVPLRMRLHEAKKSVEKRLKEMEVKSK